ncbi:MAG: hypothetical protein WC728_03315 [Elusimicrobiota bacterium]
MLKKPFAVLCASALLLQCCAGLADAADKSRTMKTASGAVTQGDRTYDGSARSGTAGQSSPAPLAGPGSGTPKIISSGKVEPKVESESPAPPAPEKKEKKVKAEADAPPTDMTAVIAAAGLGLAGAALGMALGGPMGACAGFLIGVFVGALAAKVYEYVKEKQEAKKQQPAS